MLSVNYSLNCVTFDPKGKILQVGMPLIYLISPCLCVDRICEGGSKAGLNFSRPEVKHSCGKSQLYLPGRAWCPVNQESLVTQLTFYRSSFPWRRVLMTWQAIKRRCSTSMITWVLPLLVWPLMLATYASSCDQSASTIGTPMIVIIPPSVWSQRLPRSHKWRLTILLRDPLVWVSLLALLMRQALTCSRHAPLETTTSTSQWPLVLALNPQRPTWRRIMRALPLLVGRSLSSTASRH